MITKKPTIKKINKKASVIKNFKPVHVFYAVKVFFIILVAVSLLYSFAVVPVLSYHQAKQDKLQVQQDKNEKIACHEAALASATNISAQIQQQNQNLPEGQEPSSVNEIAVYDTQYSLCIRSKGL